jgi:pimeloyl-ACP methyl ester carboxylesterase
MLDAGNAPVEAGSLDISKAMTPLVTQLTAQPSADFSIPDAMDEGHYEGWFGPNAPESEKQKISAAIAAHKKTYAGEAGCIKLHQTAMALVTRDSLLLRLADIKCPVLWIAASKDPVVSEKTAKSEVGLFRTTTQLEIVEGAYHLPTWTHTEQVHKAVIAFVKQYGGLKDARALREAVGMVDI